MRKIICGQRGTGKTALLKRLQKYYQSENRKALFYDLDEEIERSKGISIEEVFKTKGEHEFRKIEQQVFLDLPKETDLGEVWISVGAGFDLKYLNEEDELIYVSRRTDRDGRIFFNRPRLSNRLSHIAEFQERANGRAVAFEERANLFYVMPEGIESENEIEKNIFLNEISHLGGVLTLLPENLKSHTVWKRFINQRIYWGLDFFEVRDDLISHDKFAGIANDIPKQNLIYAFRKNKIPHPFYLDCRYIDWPAEWGSCNLSAPTILSLHEREPLLGGFEKSIKKIENVGKSAQLLKLAVEVNSFEELEMGHQWHLKNPQRNQFLPRSKNGRWNWYRRHMKGWIKLNFMREGAGSSFDQPTLCEWLSTFEKPYRFAAILGTPVFQSRTPIEQAEFFKNRGLSVYAIDLSVDEWTSGAFDFLKELGLAYAAVTAPLKVKAFESCERVDEKAQELKSVNTVYINSSGVCTGVNTDFEGFQVYKEKLKNFKIAIWGGGGTLEVIKTVLPEAISFSQRTGKARDESARKMIESQNWSPEAVVWASGNGEWPPKDWKPKLVVDLSYSDASQAREFAIESGAEYISGLAMFKEQARHQRIFWEEVENASE